MSIVIAKRKRNIAFNFFNFVIQIVNLHNKFFGRYKKIVIYYLSKKKKICYNINCNVMTKNVKRRFL